MSWSMLFPNSRKRRVTWMAISQGQWQMATALLMPRTPVIGVMARGPMSQWQAVICFNLLQRFNMVQPMDIHGPLLWSIP